MIATRSGTSGLSSSSRPSSSSPDWGIARRADPDRASWSSIGRRAHLDFRSLRARAAGPPRQERIDREDAGRASTCPARRSPPIFAAVGAALLLLGPRLRRARSSSSASSPSSLTLLYWLAEAPADLRPRRRPDRARRCRPWSTTGRRRACTCPDRRSARSSARSGVRCCSLGLVFGGWLLLAGVIALIADPGRLAGRRASRNTARRSRPTGPATSRRRRPADAVAAARASLAVAVVGGVRAPGRLAATGRGQRRGAGRVRVAPRHRGSARRVGPAGTSGRRRRATGRRDRRCHARRPRTSRSSRRPSTAPADKPFTLAFDNEDPGTPHNVDVQGRERARSSSRARSSPASRPRSTTSPRLPAGTYTFVCTVHPT